MKQTVNNLLLKLGEEAQEERLKLSVDMAIYQKLVQVLPRLFPMPDEFYTKTVVASDYDAAFIYEIKEGEHPEALRTILSLMLGLPDWEIEIDKTKIFASLRSVKRFGNYVVLVRIAGINPEEFEYQITCDTGTILTGPVRCKQFVPLDNNREDVSPEIFYERLKTASYHSFIYSKQAFICSIAAQGLPPNLPLPDSVLPALGLNYDLDLVYITDPKGQLRSKLDKLLGYVGWAGSIDKAAGYFSLHAIFTVQCNKYPLKVRASIFSASKLQESLFLIADLPDRLVYKATRPSDPDYLNTLKLFEAPNGAS
jgi:hypothetical protein